MDWTELIVTVASGDIETAGNIAQMTVPYGIYIEDYSMLEQEVREIAKIDLIDEELLKQDRSHGRIHIYISPEANPAEAAAFIKERLEAENISFSISSGSCDVESCLTSWKKYFSPLDVGEKLLIRPVWRDDFDPRGRVILNLAQQDCVALRAVMRLGWAMPRPVNMISGRDYFPFAVLTPGT